MLVYDPNSPLVPIMARLESLVTSIYSVYVMHTITEYDHIVVERTSGNIMMDTRLYSGPIEDMNVMAAGSILKLTDEEKNDLLIWRVMAG